MKLGHSKTTYLVKNAISPIYRQQTVKLLQHCDAFVIAFDESEVNKRNELELMVKLAHPEHGIQRRHYVTIDLEDGTAPTIVNTILNSFEDDGIDFEKKLISSMSDGCITNEGWKGGVKKFMGDKVPQLKDVGSCIDHHIGNAFEYAVKAFDNDCHEALVNIFQDLGGVKGKGLTKKKAFEKVCGQYKLTVVAFKKLCTTRFRSYVIALKPVLANWYGIVSYYASAKKLTKRQTNLKSFFVDREIMTKLKLNFIWSTSKYMIEALDFFEQNKVQIHNLHTKMTEVLVCCLKRFVQAEVVETMDDEGNLSMKSSRELLHADLTKTLDRKNVFIGDNCAKFIKTIGLTPSSPQLDWFFDKVYLYHKTVVVFLQKYFRKGLLSTDLKYLTAFAPKNRCNYRTPHMLKYLAKSFSKVVENIVHDGADMIISEIDVYSTDIDVKAIDETLPYADYWNEVQKLQSGGEWSKYDILPRLALAMGTFFNSNSEVERGFSVETDITRDPKKNRMSQDLLDSHMQIHYGVESPLNYDKAGCRPCNSGRKRAHCHCSQATITEEMVNQSKKAYIDESDNEEDDIPNVAFHPPELLKEEENKRLENFKLKLKQIHTFYSPDLMGDVYEKESDKKKKKQKDDIDIPSVSGSNISGSKKKLSCSTVPVSKEKTKEKPTKTSLDKYTIPKIPKKKDSCSQQPIGGKRHGKEVEKTKKKKKKKKQVLSDED